MILLDTHALLWVVTKPQRVPRKTQAAIRRAQVGGGLAISSATLWELASMAAQQRVRIDTTPQAWVHRLLEVTGVAVLDITIEIAVAAAHLPPGFPPDPFDRLIAGTALVERVPLVTADQRIQDSGVVSTVW